MVSQRILVLGSGLGRTVEFLDSTEEIPFSVIDNLPDTSVQGHVGRIYRADDGNTVWHVISGRLHDYEGHDINTITLPIKYLLDRHPISSITFTNTSGSLNKSYPVGRWTEVIDIISLPGYPSILQDSKPHGLSAITNLTKGIYAFQRGPSMGTRAEYAMLRFLGATMVGMSVYPDLHAKLFKTDLTINLLTLPVVMYDIPDSELMEITHQEVLEIADRCTEDLARIIKSSYRDGLAYCS